MFVALFVLIPVLIVLLALRSVAVPPRTYAPLATRTYGKVPVGGRVLYVAPRPGQSVAAPHGYAFNGRGDLISLRREARRRGVKFFVMPKAVQS